MGGPNLEISVELKKAQISYLKEIVEKYDLADESKAIRCLINFVRDESDREAEIFEDVRCLDC